MTRQKSFNAQAFDRARRSHFKLPARDPYSVTNSSSKRVKSKTVKVAPKKPAAVPAKKQATKAPAKGKTLVFGSPEYRAKYLGKKTVVKSVKTAPVAPVKTGKVTRMQKGEPQGMVH